ncbi:MAG: SDR family oxidoreductase [Pseudomonadota bacterium]
MPNPETHETVLTPARYTDLEDRTVFVSGGATGIGASIVQNLAEQGARVWFVDVNSDAGAALSARAGDNVTFMSCDVTDAAVLQQTIGEAHAETGDLYGLVNNAAHDQRHRWSDVSPEGWDDIVAVNLKHQYFAAQAAAPLIAASGGGGIANFGSIAPTRGTPDLSVYSTCKAAVFGMTRSLAREFGEMGVRVNSVVPGAILTERQLELWITPDVESGLLAAQCLKRRMVEQDIADMVLFLLSQAARGCTGQEFRVDGGLF